jgi:hypothetical protein
VLPAAVTAVDLTGNEIYEYSGLVNVVTEENGDETVTTLRALTKLYLPESARHNCDEIVYFYTNNPAADTKIQNAQGALTTYNTLREVPDATLRAHLQENFPSLFDSNNKDMINIANRLYRADEASRGISQAMIPTAVINAVEGVQFIMMNPSWRGTSVWLFPQAVCEFPYLKVKPTISLLRLEHIATGYLNLAEAENLIILNLNDNPTIEHIDLSGSIIYGQRGYEMEWTLDANFIAVNNCPKLKTIVLPQKAEYAGTIQYTYLPLLEEVDLSHFRAIGTLSLANLPGLKKLVYFTLDDGVYSIINRSLYFTISEDIYQLPETKAFLDTYHEYCISQFAIFVTPIIFAYDWAQHYQ